MGRQPTIQFFQDIQDMLNLRGHSVSSIPTYGSMSITYILSTYYCTHTHTHTHETKTRSKRKQEKVFFACFAFASHVLYTMIIESGLKK